MPIRYSIGDLKMRNTILATLVAFGLSAFAFGGTTPATTPAAPAAAPAAQPAAAAKPDAKAADCEKQAKAKGLKGPDSKKFVADCVKAK
jgi:hypothetical protein